MTTNILAKPFSWSYSRIKNFETCPRRYHEVDVLKNFKEEQSPQLRDGFLVHDAMAKAITQGGALPANMPFDHWIRHALKGRTPETIIEVEQKLAITQGFGPCDYFDKVKRVWLRTVADVLRIDGKQAHIIDWKTGQVKPDMMQLMLIATCAMAHHPQIFNIKAELVWLGYDTSTVEEFTVDDVVKFWGDRMFDAVNKLKDAHEKNHFPPTPMGLCKRYCLVTTCEHCGQ
jgi:hypothetical protein